MWNVWGVCDGIFGGLAHFLEGFVDFTVEDCFECYLFSTWKLYIEVFIDTWCPVHQRIRLVGLLAPFLSYKLPLSVTQLPSVIDSTIQVAIDTIFLLRICVSLESIFEDFKLIKRLWQTLGDLKLNSQPL